MIKFKKFGKNPKEVIEVPKEHENKLDLGVMYNTIAGCGYNITYHNINNILNNDIQWQIILMYGINLALILPATPHASALVMYINRYKDELFSQSDKDIFQILNDMNDENIVELVNKLYNHILNNIDNIEKFLIFKILIDLTTLIIVSMVNYSLSDKDIEEKIKDKLIVN